jgi:Fibrobacter succinogenes major domain (Fib_succ_major).
MVMKNRILSVTFPALLISLMMSSCAKKDEPIVYQDPGLVWENPADITEGTELSYTWQLNARADVDGTYVYTPPAGAQFDIGNNQELKVDFYPDGYYKRASKTVKINVLPSLKPTNGLTTAVFNNTKTYGKMTDQEGNEYKTIVIGTQIWMAENLRTTKFRDDTNIPNIGYGKWQIYDPGVYCSYNNTIDPVSIATYGRLYNWYTVTNSHNLAPIGWHVPTDADWTTLINYLGGEAVAGGKMKETGTTHWIAPNTGATNESGFTSLPSGLRGSSVPEPFFSNMGGCSYYWSSTEPGPNYAVGRFCRLDNDNASVYRYDNYKMQGFAVRLVKD